MRFLERLRDYLDRVGRAPEGLPAFHVEEPLPTLLEEVVDRILQIVAPNASREEVTRLVHAAIDWELWDDGERTGGSRGLDEEIGRVAESVRARLTRKRNRDGWESPARYAFEIRAIARNHADRHTLTRSGAALLKLPGIDAVRWLLALESAQSLGPADEWRVSSELAAQLLAEPKREIEVEELVDGSWRFSLPTIRRLEAMQLLRFEGQDVHRGRPNFSYTVFARARPLLEEIAERRPTPFAVLADALLRDDVARALEGARPGAERVLHDSAAASTALQAQMMVHEIRNALVPSQIAFNRIDREIAETRPDMLPDHRKRVDAGFQRALTFADNMLRVAVLGAEPAAPFDAAAAIRDAIAGVAADWNGSLRYAPPDSSLSMIGCRTHFVLAVTNLLRNATQAATDNEGIVEVSIEERDGEIAVCVDDNGPGVPVEQRDIIFKPGVTSRPGGSGQGLALVRQVVVGELRGSVACGDSPIGGARFEIVAPVKGVKGP